MSGEPATGQRLPRAAASHSPSRKHQAAKNCEQGSRELCCLQGDAVQVGVPWEGKNRAGCSQRRRDAVQEVKEGSRGSRGGKLHLMLTARQVAHLLVVCGVGDGECRGQVIQKRRPRPMLAVCQFTDVRGACEAGRGGRWRALRWKGGTSVATARGGAG
jgi:hypothetical protein